MSCSSFREALLGDPTGEVSSLEPAARAHFEACERCTAELHAVEMGIARLAAGLSAAGPGFGADRAVELASLQESIGPTQGRAWTSRWRWAVPAGAIAGLAVWLGVSSQIERDIGSGSAVVRVAELSRPVASEEGAQAEESATPGFSIDAPDEGRVAVFQTSNPKIRVVWYYRDAGSDD